MPENPFDFSLSKYLVPQQKVTDTVTPIPLLPVYFIHSFEQPFCADVRCTCRAHQREVVTLFVKIIEGHVQLEPAATLLVENRKEHCA